MRFFGDYELIDEIARGGMGIVYRARQLSLNRMVAIKMILDGPLARSGFVARFQIEAEAAAQLNHPNIVPIYEIGEYEGRHFFSMELLEGGNLADEMPHRSLPPGAKAAESLERQREIAQLVAAVAQGVHHAHQRGILHRDLKPANILFDTDGGPHVTDFGLAKLVEEDTALTQTGSLLGTPAYMAPEQAAGDSAPVTTVADVYSLGAILYHLLTGRPPFQAATTVQTLRQVVESDPVPPQTINASIDRRLATICLKCLQKDPVRRYTSARALAEDLQRWQNGETILALPATRTDNFVRWCRRKPAVAALAGLLLLALIAVAIVSTIAAYRINRARDSAVAAEGVARDKLWESLVSEARALRWSGRPGRRFDGLAAVRAAAAIRKSTELRNEAIACLSLTDIRSPTNVPATSNDAERIWIDWPRQRYFFGAADGSISVRRWSDHSELLHLPSVGRIDFLLGVSPDGRWLGVLGPDNHVFIVDLEQRVPTANIPDASTVMFSPDSSMAAVDVGTNSFALVKMDGSAALTRYPLPDGVWSFAWHPDGKTIATPSIHEVYLIDATNGALLRRFPLATHCTQVAWAPDGIHLALAEDDHLIHILNVTDGSEAPPLAGHLGAVTCVAFQPRGNLLASGSWDGQMRLWDWREAKEIISAVAGSEAVIFSPDGRNVVVYRRSQSQFKVFEIAENDAAVDLQPPDSPSIPNPDGAGGDTLLFGRDDRWLATSDADSASLWDPPTGRLLARLDHSPLSSLQPLPEGERFLGLRGDFHLLTTRWADGQLNATFTGLFRPAIPTQLQKWFPHGFPGDILPRAPLRSAISASGRTAVFAGAGRCFVFNLTNQSLQAITELQLGVKYVSVSPNDRWVATGCWHSPNVKIWDAETGKEVTTLPTDNSANVAFSPDGQWLVTSTGAEYRFWRVRDWTQAHGVARPGLDDFPGTMAFSADGKILAVAYTRSIIRLVEPNSGDLLAQLEPVPGNDLITLAFNSDASELAVTRVNAPPQIWHLRRIRQQLAEMSLDW